MLAEVRAADLALLMHGPDAGV